METILITEMLLRLYKEFASIKEIVYFIEEDSIAELEAALEAGVKVQDRYRCYKLKLNILGKRGFNKMKITDEVYALEATKGAYAYLILGKENILVDTGHIWNGKRILSELQAMNIDLKNIKHILLTHHDVDHIGNAHMLQTLTNAKLWASSEDIPYIKGSKARPGIKKIFSFVFGNQKLEKVLPYSEDMEFKDITIIPTPGHTPGHVCILYKDILFAGDLVASKKGKLTPFPNMNWDQALLKKSIENIANLPFKWVCPAHGKPMERGEQWEKLY